VDREDEFHHHRSLSAGGIVIFLKGGVDACQEKFGLWKNHYETFVEGRERCAFGRNSLERIPAELFCRFSFGSIVLK